MRNKKVVSLICAVAVMGSLSMGATSASAASFTLPKLPAVTLPANVSTVVSSVSKCASQRTVAGAVSCVASAVGVKASLPSNLSSLIPSNLSSLLKGVNLSNLSSLVSGLLKK